MTAPEIYGLAQVPITAHSFNRNKSRESIFIATLLRPARSLQGAASDLAVSLDSNDVQIFSKAGNDWNATEVLSEVRAIRFHTTVLSRIPIADDEIARQTDHVHRLGP